MREGNQTARRREGEHAGQAWRKEGGDCFVGSPTDKQGREDGTVGSPTVVLVRRGRSREAPQDRLWSRPEEEKGHTSLHLRLYTPSP